MRVYQLIPIALTAAILPACGGDHSTGPAAGSHKSVDVFTVGVAFSPTPVTINVGDTVRFNIVPGPDGDGHDVTFDASPAGAPPNITVTLNGVISRAFTTRGTFHYNCFVHPGMFGDVEVQ
jgi:plastocyanin